MSVHVESWVTVPNHTPWTISLLSEVPDADNLQPTDVFGDGFQDDDVWRDARMPQVIKYLFGGTGTQVPPEWHYVLPKKI